MRRLAISRGLVVAGALAALLCTPNARGAEVRSRVSTVLLGRELAVADGEARDLPLLGLLQLDARDLGLPAPFASRLFVSGFGRLALADDVAHANEADATLAFLEVRRGDATISAGRQELLLGAGRLHLIDGVQGVVDLPAGLRASAYVGGATRPKMRFDRGNWLTGGRLAELFASSGGNAGEVGVSFSEERAQGLVARRELALDTWLGSQSTRLVGFAALGLETERLSEASLSLSRDVGRGLYATIDATRTEPSQLLPMTSLFSVFSDSGSDAFGGDVGWTPDPFWSVVVSGHALLFEPDAWGHRLSLRATTYREPSHRNLIGLEASRTQEVERGYTQVRAYAVISPCPCFRFHLEAYGQLHDEAFATGERTAGLFRLGLTHPFNEPLVVTGSLLAGATPLAGSLVEGMVRLSYAFAGDIGGAP